MSSAFEGLPKTPNLKLNKPGYDNVADIEALNENADILDEEIQGIKNTFVKSVNGINAGDGGNVDLGIMPISQGGTGASTAEQALRNLGVATQAEAEAGVIDDKIMTPLMVLQSILKNAPKQDLTPYAKLANPAFTGTPTAPTASKTTNNTQLATTAFVHALAGAVNNGGIVAASLNTNGYVKFANGLILQWGHVDAFRGEKYVSLPISATCRVAVCSYGYQTEVAYVTSVSPSNAQLRFYNPGNNAKDVYWLAICW